MKNLTKRNAEILKALETESMKKVAARFHLSRSHVSRLRSDSRRAEAFQEQSRARATGSKFGEIGTTGLRQFAGTIDEDYERVFKPLYRKIQLFNEMGNDPIVAAVLLATKMTIRRLDWTVEPVGEEEADEQAVEFLDGCMNDMSLSWNDIIDQALDILQYGFSLFELVYKRRLGADRDPSSRFDDGKIGWRKWTFIGQDSLAQSEPWLFDEHGGLQGFRQQMYNSGQTVEIPIDKAILFRTTARKGDPEGRAILRAMYPAWYMKKNLEEIEAISAERFGAGLPVVYLGKDTSRSSDTNSDLTTFKDITRNIRIDEQMGVVIPYAKMGSGALDGDGVLLELLTPSGGRPVVLNEVIQRYEKRMAMVGLAQFIHLGMDKVGTQALAGTTVDFFTLSVSAWANMIEETIHRFGTERLFKLNNFAGLTGIPRIVHTPVFRESLIDVATYVDKLTGVALLTPDPELEAHLRQLADLPERPVEVIEREQTEKRRPEEEKPESEGGNEELIEGMTEQFQTDLRGGGPGRRPKAVEFTNDYQRELEGIYDDWSRNLARDLARASENDRDEIIAAALAALLLLLRTAGRRNLTDALGIALGDDPPTLEMLQALADAVAENDRFLESSLIPALDRKVRSGLTDEDILKALALGTGAAALLALLATSRARVALYAGGVWTFMNRTTGLNAIQQGKHVFAHLDPRAQHCADCPQFQSVGGREYDSFEAYLAATGGRVPGEFACQSGCRCWLIVA